MFKPAEVGIEPWLNLSNAAKLLQIAPKTLRLAAEAGEIEAIHPLPDGPWIFARAALQRLKGGASDLVSSPGAYEATRELLEASRRAELEAQAKEEARLTDSGERGVHQDQPA